jgi:hypothetical protein
MTALNTYTVRHYNLRNGTDATTAISAENAEHAIEIASQRRAGFNFTRKNQKAENEADRDNAHTQLGAEGLVGYSACRTGREEQYLT